MTEKNLEKWRHLATLLRGRLYAVTPLPAWDEAIADALEEAYQKGKAERKQLEASYPRQVKEKAA